MGKPAMKVNANLVLVAGILGGGYLLLRGAGNAAAAAASAVGTAVNPINRDNIVNRAYGAVWNVFTDGKGTLGTDIYDWLHPEG